MRDPVLITGMSGLGDNLYQRAILRHFMWGERFYLMTPWPQIYSDMPHILPVRREGIRLRTHSKNMNTAPGYVPMPEKYDRKSLHYPVNEKSILQCLAEHIGLPDIGTFDMSGPPIDPSIPVPDRPYVLVRPATVRKEWRAGSRNPYPEYIAQAAQEAIDRGYYVVSVADLEKGDEWAVGDLPPAHVRYHKGQLGINALMAYMKHASAVIGGVGWIVPMAMAYRTPLFLIYGGWGFSNGPHRILDDRIDTSHITQVFPDTFCMCSDRSHDCNKTISNLPDKIDQFLNKLSITP